MGLFQRIGDILRSNINDLIARAEDPERMLNAAIEDMKRQVAEAKSRVASSIADQSRLVTQRDREQKKADSWEEKAMTAVKAGRDDLAVEALAKKREHQSAADMYEDQLETQRIAVDELKRALGELVTKLEETKRKRNLLVARAKRAEAQRHLAVTLSAAHESSASERLERLEARIEREEAEAEATWEVAALSPGGYDNDLSEEIAQLGAGSPEDDLATLKEKMRQMSAGEDKKALPSGGGKGSRSDADLAAEIAEAAGDGEPPSGSEPQAPSEASETEPASTTAADLEELEAMKAKLEKGAPDPEEDETGASGDADDGPRAAAGSKS
jgi:phage shock protein A